MMKPLNCPNLFLQQSLSGSTVSLHFSAPRYQNYQIHMVDMAFALSFFHFFPVSQDCLFFGKKSFEVAKVTLRAVPSSSTTLMKKNVVFVGVHCRNSYVYINQVFLCGYQFAKLFWL